MNVAEILASTKQSFCKFCKCRRMKEAPAKEAEGALEDIPELKKHVRFSKTRSLSNTRQNSPIFKKREHASALHGLRFFV